MLTWPGARLKGHLRRIIADHYSPTTFVDCGHLCHTRCPGKGSVLTWRLVAVRRKCSLALQSWLCCSPVFKAAPFLASVLPVALGRATGLLRTKDSARHLHPTEAAPGLCWGESFRLGTGSIDELYRTHQTTLRPAASNDRI